MNNLSTLFAEFLDICKQFAGNLVNELENIKRRGVVTMFSDLEVIALSLMAETLSIDNENSLFSRLSEYTISLPNMISRRLFNDRRKFSGRLCKTIKKRIADAIDGG